MCAHHGEQEGLHFVDTASPVTLGALRSVNLISAEEAPTILFRSQKTALGIASINFERAPHNHLIDHSQLPSSRS
ncbi:hypothetical protein BFL28_11505 [Sphingomonas turrisvirgatae]|uniref:Uncharacterized protein n=1 Tax=Sphingomonas turrisvirgatae TaxID=1888892 RepID=A0A1E3LZD5_9SPHN|nr:hypothetical protein BFL28_11505 [Sphingomonas turrisvirgatae]RSU65326.1 hypothetical protein BRX36_11165 [Sphingomonas sp. S-NIH.Pt1_0416]